MRSYPESDAATARFSIIIYTCFYYPSRSFPLPIVSTYVGFLHAVLPSDYAAKSLSRNNLRSSARERLIRG